MAGALLALMVTFNVVALLVPEERGHDDFKYAPPQLGWLQRLFWPDAARDTVVAPEFSLDAAPVEGRVFRSTPLAAARVGVPYVYVPRFLRPVRGFEMRGAPRGLEIDTATGRLGGTPGESGKFEVMLEGRLESGQLARQTFTLFVDDRTMWLGADERGLDLVRRTLLTGRALLLPGLLAVLVGVGGGVLLGAFAGFYPGPLRAGLRVLTLLLQSVPGTLLLFIGAVISGFSTFVAMIVVGLLLLPETANAIRERVERFCERDFVEAARELGQPDRVILWNEIIWYNARTLILARVTQAFVFAILAEVTLAYVGLVDANNEVGLGKLLLDGRKAILDGPAGTQVIAVVAIVTLLLVISGFSLMERCVVASWERRR